MSFVKRKRYDIKSNNKYGYGKQYSNGFFMNNNNFTNKPNGNKSNEQPKKRPKKGNDFRFKVLQPDGTYGYPLNVSGIPQAKCQHCYTLNVISQSLSGKHFNESYITCECSRKQQFLGVYVPNSRKIPTKTTPKTTTSLSSSLSSTITTTIPTTSSSSSLTTTINNDINLPETMELNHQMKFGKFKGQMIREFIITKQGLSWLEWAVNNVRGGKNDSEISFVRQALYQYKQSQNENGNDSFQTYGSGFSPIRNPIYHSNYDSNYDLAITNSNDLCENDNDHEKENNEKQFHRLSTVPKIKIPQFSLEEEEEETEESDPKRESIQQEEEEEEEQPVPPNFDNFESEFEY